MIPLGIIAAQRRGMPGGGAWVTIHSAPQIGYENGWSGYTHRQWFGPSLVVAGAKVRLTAAANTAKIGSMYVGIGATAGDRYDFSSPPVQVTFDGWGSVEIGAASLVMSDEIPLTILAGQSVLVATYFSGASVIMSAGAMPSRSSHYKTGNDAATVNASGYSLATSSLHLLSKVEIWQP